MNAPMENAVHGVPTKLANPATQEPGAQALASQENSQNAYAAGVQDKTAHCGQKAARVGTGGLSNDDPAALVRLRAELACLEQTQDLMKAANKAIRAHRTPETKAAALVALGLEADLAAQLLQPDCAGRLGFTYRENTAENRVLFVFDGKPDAATRAILKAHAFRWSPLRAAWVRQLTHSGVWHGQEVLKRLTPH